MTTQRFTIKIRFKSFNTYLGMSVHPRAKYKREVQDVILWAMKARKLKRVKKPVVLTFLWYEDRKGKQKARDKDNVAYAKKFILDALQEGNILPNDNDLWVVGFVDYFIYGQGQKVEVIIQEVDHAEITQSIEGVTE